MNKTKRWDECMWLLEHDMKWILANLEKIQEFKVPWNHYGRFKKQCPMCLKYYEINCNDCKKCGFNLKKVRFQTFGVGKPTHL